MSNSKLRLPDFVTDLRFILAAAVLVLAPAAWGQSTVATNVAISEEDAVGVAGTYVGVIRDFCFEVTLAEDASVSSMKAGRGCSNLSTLQVHSGTVAAGQTVSYGRSSRMIVEAVSDGRFVADLTTGNHSRRLNDVSFKKVEG